MNGRAQKVSMGRQRRTYQRREYDGKAAVDGHRRGWGYIVAVSFFDGGNRSTLRKPPIRRKSLVINIYLYAVFINGNNETALYRQ
jgi:hypothetical protein